MRTFPRRAVVALAFAPLGMHAVMAQEQMPQQPPSDMMHGQGTMPMMDMMQQMGQMMETCNKMMQAQMRAPAPPAQPQE